MAFLMVNGPGHSALQAAPLSFEIVLEDWDIAQPRDLRFGVVTQNSQGQSYLSRLSTQQPAPLPPAQRPSYGAFSRAPSQAQVNEAQGILQASMHQQASGYAGIWWRLASVQQPQANYLSFWVKTGGDFRLKLADALWLQQEDAQTLGPLAHFYAPPRADTGDWRQVIIPLSALSAFSLDAQQLKQLVIQAEPTVIGAREILLRSLAFTPHLPSPKPPFEIPRVEHVENGDSPTAISRDHATWVWQTDELLQHPEGWPDFVTALRRQQITQVYLQWPRVSAALPVLARLIHAFQSQGLRVHALAGDPRWALRPYHQEALAVFDAVVAYQRAYPQAPVVGLHYDIEPYLLPGFFGRRQSQFLQDHVHLAQQLYARAQAERLLLSYALPHWFDAPDEFTGQRLNVHWQGQTQPFHGWLQHFSDAIALMDYKTVVTGPQGIVASAEAELAFARAHGKKVWIALETMALPDEQLFTFSGPPQIRRPQGTVLAVFVQKQTWHFAVLSAAQALPEGAAQALYWPLKDYAQVDATQLSFAQKGAEALTQVLQATENTLGQDPAFGGMAVHHSESFLALMSQKSP